MKPSDALSLHRESIKLIVERNHALNPRIFGSVLHGLDSDKNDLDLLIDVTPETTLFDIGAIRVELINLLNVKVDVLTPNSLPESFRDRVIQEARPI